MMELIYRLLLWYKEVLDKIFAMVGFNVNEPGGLAILAIAIIALNAAGNFFMKLADKLDEE